MKISFVEVASSIQHRAAALDDGWLEHPARCLGQALDAFRMF